MRAIVFDTETTGLRPGYICQLAYIATDIPSRGSGGGGNGSSGGGGSGSGGSGDGGSGGGGGGGGSGGSGGGSGSSGGVNGLGGGAIEASNIYFTVPYVPKGASNIHGLTTDTLRKLSGGQTFSDRADEIEAAFSACDLWVAHNIDFDRSFLLAEFQRIGRAPREGRSYCTMRELGPECNLPPTKPGTAYKFPSLAEAVSHLAITDEDIHACCASVFGDSQYSRFHEARYDVAAAYLCFLAAIGLGIAP